AQIKKLKKLNINSDKYRWLCQEVVRLNMPCISVLHRNMLVVRRMEQKLKNFNLDINLSGWIENMAKF
ncbi:MAG: hypothetical protein ACYT04_54025, partial [Nostoc sp.]